MRRVLYILIVTLAIGLIACGEKNNRISIFPDPDPDLNYFYIRKGMSKGGDVIYNIYGDYIRSGMSKGGDIIYNIEKNK